MVTIFNSYYTPVNVFLEILETSHYFIQQGCNVKDIYDKIF